MIPAEVEGWLRSHGYGEVSSQQNVGGGCINNGTRLRMSGGSSFFLKTNLAAPPDMFDREAEGLLALGKQGGQRVPEPHYHGPTFLLMEDLQPSGRIPDYWTFFGRQLAALHQVTNSQFGFYHDNYIGSTPQPNRWMEDGFLFFGEQRLVFQAQLAGRAGRMDAANVRRVEALAQRLPELVPAQPASLVHGDLWSGNAISDAFGAPALIDPAAHFGWAEAELAMTALFGAFPEAFYRAYQETRPLELGWRERFDLYNLYHLLNHLNLFGGSYLGEALAVLRRYRL